MPKSFKTFDFYIKETKTAVSAKTMDTQTMAKLNKPNQIYASIKRNIDAVVSFESYGLADKYITSDMISHREIQLAIPSKTTKFQRKEIDRAIDYGNKFGVKVKVTEVKR